MARERVRTEITIGDLEVGLQIDQHDLDTALIQQPGSFYEVAKTLALRISRRDAAKQHLSELEATVDKQLRETASRNDEKITEKEVESLKRVDKDVSTAATELADLNYEVAQWTALKEAFIQRSYVLKDLVGLYTANYYADAAGTGRDIRDRKNVAGDDARRRMNEERNRLRNRTNGD